MKHLVCASLFAVLFTSCSYEYSEGTSTSTDSTSTVKEKEAVEVFELGLSCERSYMSKSDGEFKMNATFGENIAMNFLDVQGLEVVDGAIRVDIMFLFTSLEGDTVLFFDYGDIPEQDFEIPDEEEIDFNVYTPISSPVWSDNKYIFRGGFKDVRTGNAVEGETTLKVNPNYNIDIEKGGIGFAEVYLFDATENNFIVNQEINRSNNNQLRIRSIDGFELIDGNALIGASLVLTDANGEELLNLEDLGADMKNGMPYDEIKDILTIDFSIAESIQTPHIDLKVKVWDKNSDHTLDISTRLSVL